MPDETDLIDPGPGLEDAPESNRADVAAVEKAFSPEKDFRRWSHGESPNGSPDNDSPPPPWARDKEDYPYAPHRDPKAKISEKPDFKEFGGKQKAEEDTEATVKGKASQRSSKAVQSDKGEPEEPDTKPRGKVKKAEAEREEPAKGESDEFTKEDVDEELDRLKSPDGPAQKIQWDELKGKTKAWRERSRSLEAQLKAKDEELRLHKQSLDEDDAPRLKEEWNRTRKENELLREYRQRFDVTTSPQFQRTYQQPANETLAGVIHAIVQKNGGSQEWQDWGLKVWRAEQAGELPENYWVNDVLPHLNDADLKQQAINGLVRYGQLRQQGFSAADQLSRDPALAQRWFILKEEDRRKDYEQGIELAKADLLQEYKDWPEFEDEKSAEEFKKEVTPIIANYLTLINDDSVGTVQQARNQLRVAAKAFANEHEVKRLKKENSQLKLELNQNKQENRRINTLHSTVAKAGGVSARSRSRGAIDILENDRAAVTRLINGDED